MTKKKRRNKDKDLVIPEGTVIEYANVSFKFTLTKDEAKEVLTKPNGSIARRLRRYMYSILKEASSRFFKEEKDEADKQDCKEK